VTTFDSQVGSAGTPDIRYNGHIPLEGNIIWNYSYSHQYVNSLWQMLDIVANIANLNLSLYEFRKMGSIQL